ncbi:heme-binding protein, partial [Salmonella enterica subsp. enterica serovar Newport]|nr:heme-binding protein [Salmonella enterica subsp. enterica serovar Newport]ECI2309856.1 heme-binding protein [Salmonella enterica subsp. enterica serovar Infantis]EGI5078611.1 heme-binding protein [Salmonella enterica subsp. enterica serovar Infantis]
MKRILSGALLMGCIVPIASATDVVLSQKNLSFHIADKLAQNVLLVCARDNYNVAVTVVDYSGTPLVMKRMDNAGPHTIEASRMKAFTALSTRTPTDNVM